MEKNYINFSKDEISEAVCASIIDLARRMGYTPVRTGSYYSLKEHDSIRIYPPYNTYVRFSDHTGGDAISFVRNMDPSHPSFKDAVTFILGDNTISRVREENMPVEKQPFLMPESSGRTDSMYRYLTKTRCLSERTVNFFYEHGMIYEDTHKNVVFVGRDKEGVMRYAAKRGTFSIGKPYKKDAPGSEKAYSFNLANEKSTSLVVTEAPIDLMSYAELTGDFSSNMVSLGGTSSTALVQFLKDHPGIKEVHMFLDCDIPGTKATVKIREELRLRYGDRLKVYDRRNPYNMEAIGAKDINEFLVKIRKAEWNRKQENTQIPVQSAQKL